MDPTTIAAIIGGVSGGITGGVFGVGGVIYGVHMGNKKARETSLEAISASNKNAIAIIEGQEFRRAAGIFLAAFIKEQRILSSSVADKAGDYWDANNVVSRAIAKHEHAMIRFKPFVCKSDIEAYEKAWEKYAGDNWHFGQYIPANSLDRPVKWKLASSNIEKLLKFADPKH